MARNKIGHFRLNEAEESSLKFICKKLGVTLSDYARICMGLKPLLNIDKEKIEEILGRKING